MQQQRYIILNIHRLLLVLGVALVLGALLQLGSASAFGESKNGTDQKPTENEPIQITADQLISNNDEKYAEFIGNVKASQGNFVITSDRLRIYYHGDLVNPAKKSTEDAFIKKIVAKGNVGITSEQYVAQTDQVEYDTESMTIVLIGENSKVTSGKNSITGSKITLYRKEGQVKVEGSAKTRIKAVFYSTGETSDTFKIEPPDDKDSPAETTP